MLRAYLYKVVMVTSVLCLLAVSAQASIAADADIRKFCAPQSSSSQPRQLFLASNIGSQQAALQRNKTLQQGKIFFSTREGDALFHTTRIASGDCVLVNLQEGMQLQAVAASEPEEQIKFFPAVFLVRENKSKHYGLIAEKVLRRLHLVDKARETGTEAIVNAKTDPDLVLMYILCPSDRNSPCDLTVKQKGTWLFDKKTGKQFHLPVLARSIRNGKVNSGTRRIRINHDTPQGIYTIWGAVTGGGDSPWFRTARIDLDAALPPINAQPYPLNSFLLSRIIPAEALDDYWVNEWPLAYSLGRIALRIAPGDFEAQQNPSLQPGLGSSLFHPTHGCINTGDQQEQLLRVLIEAGVFRQEDVANPSGNSDKRWSVSPKLGRAFVIIKDRDKADDMTNGIEARK
ncbi:hypothetical protein VT98_10026 [Candidatus Electrothrix communis]|uniref:L,D-transpeptidase catalytic domain n=1 Tax=Candidatus Electrothrix communis TaxID=1859133 RepID=A0A444J9Y6_9BACT|nr:hypothetical protein VT98_10026 [Candidatus Electrothrix communis]